MNGEVIGVNTAIFTQSAGYQGIGFAMPSNTVVEIYNDLISPSHKVTRGSIGISSAKGSRAPSIASTASRTACWCRKSARRPRGQGGPQAGRHHHHHRRPPSRTATTW
jgi:S1-C subfamily serine protease